MSTEHFQKALELARKNRVLPEKVHSLTPQTGRLRSSTNQDAGHDSLQIRYSRTKVQPVTLDTLRENRIIAAFPDDPHSAPFRILRTQVLHELETHNWNTLGITAPHSGAGKSFVAVNLAISLSLITSQTVLLVDLDMRKPSIHEYFCLDIEIGITDYLVDDKPLEDILINPGFERLVILPGTKSTNESSELLASRKCKHLMNELKSRYESRIVIYDLPPLLGMDDALVAVPRLDTTILVVEANKTTSADLLKSNKLLEDYPILGTVFNKADDNEITQYGY